MYSVKQRASKHWTSRDGRSIKYIVIHGTESGTDQGEEGSVNYLEENPRGVSAHDFVFDRNVWEMVLASRGANTVAYSVLPTGETGRLANQVTYNIEGYKVVGRPMPLVVRDTIAQRTADVARRLGWHVNELPNRILFHNEVDTNGKSCPGWDFNKTEFVHKVQHYMVEGLYDYAKLCWVIESGADVLRREGFNKEVEVLLNSDSYKEWKELRDN